METKHSPPISIEEPDPRIPILALLLAAAGFLAFSNSLFSPFVFDDFLNIASNQEIRSLAGPWKALFGKSESLVAGRPVANFTFAVNYALSGTQPFGYHLTNLAIHILTGLTLFGILRQTLKSAGLAFFSVLLWMVHPLQTQSVTYLTQRLECLMGLCLALTLYSCIRAWSADRTGLWKALAVLFCWLGTGAKEVMVAAPVMVLLYDLVFVHGGVRKALRASPWLYAGLFSSWFGLAALLSTGHTFETAHAGEVGVGVLQYALAQPEVIAHYIRLALWPDALCLDYGFSPKDTAGRPGVTAVTLGLYFFGLALLAGFTLWTLRKKKPAGFLLAWFLVILAPTSSFVPLRMFEEEHRMYLPLAALTTAAVVGVSRFLERLFPGHARKIGIVLGVAAALALSGATQIRNMDYLSSLDLWADTVEKRPGNPRAQHNLGSDLVAAGRPLEGIPHLERAIEMHLQYSLAHFNLGKALMETGRTGEAFIHLEKAVELAPKKVRYRLRLGREYLKAGEREKAAAEFREVLKIKPGQEEARNLLDQTLAPGPSIDPDYPR